MAQSGGGSKENSVFEQQLNPGKDSICPSKPGETQQIKVIYVFVDMSGSMKSVVSVVQKFMAGLSTKYPLIDLILVPFGYDPNNDNAVTIVKYRVQKYEEFVTKNISWCTFGTNQYALVEFLKSFTGEIPFGFIFIGDGQFTEFRNGYNYNIPATDFINALTNAAVVGKLNNCGFLHFIYFATSSTLAKNKELEEYLSDSFQTVLRVNKQTCIPYSSGLTTNFPMTMTKYNPGYYTIPGFQINIDLFPQTIVSVIDTLGEHRSQFIMVMIEYMIRAMTTDWKLFELKNSVYSTLHRVLSMMKNTRLIDLMSDVIEFVAKTTKLWNINHIEKPTSAYTIEDIYTDVIDKWAMSRPDKTKVFEAIGKLRKEAFGGEEQLNYLKWLNNRTASYKVVIKTTFIVDPLGKYSMKEFVEFARTLFDNIIVLSAECDIPDGYKFLAMVSTIGECRWTALKTLTESIGVVLNTSKTFVLGCALHEAITSEVSGELTENSKNLYRLSELFNTARFTDPTVAEGVFKARDPNTGNEYFETSNFSPHVIGLVLKFISDRGIKFKTMNDIIVPFMKNKQQFEKNKSIIQKVIGAFQIYQVSVEGGKHPNHGKLFKLHYKKNPNDNVPSIGILYYSKGYIRFMYLDDHPEHGTLFNRDCYLLPYGQNPTDIGQFVGNFTKFDLSDSDWKNNMAIRQINSLLYHEYREKFLKGDYSSNHDEIMTKITGYMTEREATLGGSKIRYVTHARSVSVIEACRLLAISESQLDLYNSGHYSIQAYVAAKTADINPITQFNTRPDLRVMDDNTNAQVTSDEVRLVVNVKNPEFPDCVMCECSIIPGYDKLITSCEDCKYYICHNCQSSQRSLFTAEIKKGGRIPFNLCACPSCGEFSKTMYKLVTSSYYGTATRVHKLVESGNPIYACTAAKHGQCRGIVCVDDIGCVQAEGATGIFSCDSCSSGKQPILIKCPGCSGYMTHNGNSCNMMRHCMYGEHGCYHEDCPGCGPGTDCCGAKFVLSQEVCVYVPVTITIPSDRLKITMADLFTLNSAGKIVPFRP